MGVYVSEQNLKQETKRLKGLVKQTKQVALTICIVGPLGLNPCEEGDRKAVDNI